MSGAAAEIRLLGPVQVRAGGRLVDVGAARQTCVLAVLLLEANRPVSADQLVERVWGDGPLPYHPRRAVQIYVSLLRRALASVDEVTLARQSGGYLIEVDEQHVDVHQFRALISQARATARDTDAIALFERALALWHGEALSALDTSWINAVRVTLDKERQAAERDLTDLQLRQGRHGGLLARLYAWAEQYPLDERLAGQLMLALYRSGRPADALHHYRQLREHLADELGADPGPPLQRLHQQLLTNDQALAPPPPPQQGVVVPRQLPAGIAHFTGRAESLKTLNNLAGQVSGTGGAVVISVIDGTAGVGKTALAVHWAQQHADQFPDGQLYVNLRGFDPTGAPMRATAAIRGFLNALGVPSPQIPADLEEQTGLYRSLLTGRRMLIVLDNARDPEQVRPLLPGAAGCLVLVTSRNRLTSLVALQGAHPVTLDLLTLEESRALLARRLGAERVATEPAAVDDLIELCARLPLALNITAVRAAAHPNVPLAALAVEVREAHQRLDALDAGDTAANTRTVFSWSYRTLGGESARMFRLLGVHPGADITVPAAASLTATIPGQARIALDELTAVHLLSEHAPGRYAFHDLLRTYAIEQGRAHDNDDERHRALRRTLDHYLHTAVGGHRLLAPLQRSPVRLPEPVAGVTAQPIPDSPAAFAWFDQEYDRLLTIQQLAFSHGWDLQVCLLAWTMDRYHSRRGHLRDRAAIWRLALAAAERTDDPVVLTLAHQNLARAYIQAGENSDALDHLRHAVTLAEQTGDMLSQARVHYFTALAWDQHGDQHQASGHAYRALRLFQTVNDPVWQANTLNLMGWIQMRLGRYTEAQASCESALVLHRRHRPGHGRDASTLDTLGLIAHHLHDYDRALGYYHQALAQSREDGDTYTEADILDHLAETHLTLNHRGQAHDAWKHALKLYQTQYRLTGAERVSLKMAATTRRARTGHPA
ncbi:MAG: tetratricopeptide repeat protein [Streptosporangiaceae bacterium]|nr:tetratricopeptide repeat protein [Streptosporangiaceae bacterium]